jgi:hypothetical protein
MKILKLAVPAVLALMAVGCVDLVEKEEFEELNRKFDKFSAQMAQKNDMQALYSDEHVKRTTALEKKVGEMDILLNTMKAQVARLEDIAKTMRAEIDAFGKAPSPATQPGQANPAADTAKTIKIEDILLEIETIITQLRSGKIKTDEAAAKLKPYAQHAAPRLITELHDSIARFDYTKQLEMILAKFPPAELKVPLVGALKRRATREAAARIVGQVKDRELSKILEEYIGDADEDFRLNVGDALVSSRNSSGIPLLLQCLRSEQNATRTIAISTLKKVNRGDDMGYRPQLSVEANATAIKSWEDWSDKYAKTLFE